jgi:hypothetical protein
MFCRGTSLPILLEVAYNKATLKGGIIEDEEEVDKPLGP